MGKGLLQPREVPASAEGFLGGTVVNLQCQLDWI